MEDFIKHLGPLPRRFPGLLQIQTAGYIAHKREWLDRAFDTLNFSFVISGTGEYRTGSRVWEVKAPCVITQWPGRHVRYGAWLEWEEFYLIYNARAQKAIEAAQLASLNQPVWYIQSAGPVRRLLAELRELLAGDERGVGDRADRLCEQLVVESHLGEERVFADDAERAIDALRAYLEEHCAEELDFEQLALHHGFSPATFRRHWERYVGAPPARYCMKLRLRRACRMLVETGLSIGEIARRAGFEDPLYFSRKFSQSFGETASAYRQRLQTTRTGGPAQPSV